MGARRDSRETAFKIIFESIIRGPETFEDLSSTISRQLDDEQSRQFALTLVEGWREHESELMESITPHLQNWDIKRLSLVDKILLTLGIFEIRFLEDIPPVITIDESIELAKVYGGADSPSFLNGVLDSYYNSIK